MKVIILVMMNIIIIKKISNLYKQIFLYFISKRRLNNQNIPQLNNSNLNKMQLNNNQINRQLINNINNQLNNQINQQLLNRYYIIDPSYINRLNPQFNNNTCK